MKRISVAVALALSCAAGCTRSIGGLDDSASGKTPRRVSRSSTVAVRNAPTVGQRGGAVSRMIVNGKGVDADEILKPVRAELEELAQSMGPQAYSDHVRRLGATRIADKVSEMLLYQLASRRITPQEMTYIQENMVDSRIREIVTRDHRGVQHEYAAYLKGRGLTIDDVHEEMTRQFVILRHLELYVKPRVAEPTRAELLALFDANRDEWRRPPRRRLSLIETKSSARLAKDARDPSNEQMVAAREEARTLVLDAQQRLRDGADFAEIARSLSDGTRALDGGDWGWVSQGSVVERLEPVVEALYELEEGETSGVITASDSFFLVRCDKVDPGFEPRFQNVQGLLRERHFQLIYDRMIAELIAEQRASAHLEPADLTLFHRAVVETAPKSIVTPG
ncbi:MAG: peptidyl-prolyl cis-trans isomerase [Planctomycetes bacterium]|nr:peptidyl-prolyl cis-trans isomerase [Planctomycetota bacterium]